MKATTIAILNRFPNLKRVLRGARHRLFPGSAVSSHYISLQAGETNAEGERLRAAWQDDALPARQRELVEHQLRQYRAGARIDVFDVFVQCLRELPDLVSGMSLLEVGCSSGFYSEVLEIAGLPLIYVGCDYSSAFVGLARSKYPALEFVVEDATNLHYPNAAFDVVVSGCCLLHIPEYAMAVAETARVTRQYAIFHRTPVVWGQEEQWYRKQAYGVETVEIHFNEVEFLALLKINGLELISSHTLHEEVLTVDGAQGRAIRSYVCKKR